jgi:hypothetical protein
MMTAQRLDLSVFRNDPLSLPMAVIGFDLSDSAPTLAVKLLPDAPGIPLLLLAPTSIPGADGIRIVSVVRDEDDVPTTLMEGIASEATLATLPPAALPGADLTLSYDLQWTPPSDGSDFTSVEETILFGDFIIKGSVND